MGISEMLYLDLEKYETLFVTSAATYHDIRMRSNFLLSVFTKKKKNMVCIRSLLLLASVSGLPVSVIPIMLAAQNARPVSVPVISEGVHKAEATKSEWFPAGSVSRWWKKLDNKISNLADANGVDAAKFRRMVEDAIL